MADIFDVVADPTRRELLTRLRALGGGEISVGGLVQATGFSQPTVSKHLKTLRDAGLVAVREEGQHRYYRLDAGPLDAVRGWADAFVPASAVSESPVSVGRVNADRVNVDGVGAEVGERLGRAAATTAHSVRSAWDRLPLVGRG